MSTSVDKRAANLSRRPRRKAALAYAGLLALLAGVLLLVTTHGVPAMAGGIALVYASGIAFVVLVLRRIREGDGGRPPGSSSKAEDRTTRRPITEPSRPITQPQRPITQPQPQRENRPGEEEPGLSRG